MREMKIFDWRKIKKILSPIRLFLAVFVLHIAISQASYFFIADDRLIAMFDLNVRFEKLADIISIVMIFPFFYSLVRLTTIFDEMIIPRVLEAKARTSFERIKLVFTTPKFYLEFILMAVLWSVFPIKNCYYSLWNIFLRANDTTEANIIFLAIFFAVMFFVFVLGKLSAVRVIPLPKVKSESLMRDRIYLTKKKKSGQTKFSVQLALVVFTYFFAPVALIMIIPLFVSLYLLLTVFVTWKSVVALIIIIAIYFVLGVVRSIHKRKNFIIKLKAVTEAKGIALSEIRDPIRSLFKLHTGEDFSLTIGEKRYSCKMLPSRRRRTPMFIGDGGICTFVHTLVLFKIKVFSYNTSYKFGYESEGKKILIINPVPNEIYNLYEMKVTTLDNGDIIDGYKIFTGSGLLNALERDCIDR